MGTAKNETVGWGIIGCGVIGPWHAKAVQLVEGARMVACCDVISEMAEKCAEEFGDGDTAIYTDLEKMLADSNVDAVSICTPSGAHLEPAVAAEIIPVVVTRISAGRAPVIFVTEAKS